MGGGAAAARVGGASMAATRFLTAFWTFSNARTSIWRTRSRDTPNSTARSSSVTGSSASRRASKMRRSRSLSTLSASESAARRLSISSVAASVASWLSLSSISQSCHSPESPSSRIGALSEASPLSLRFMSMTSCSVTPSPLGYQLDLIGAHIPLVQRGDSALGLAQVEEELFLVSGGAHLDERPRPQNVFLDGSLDPPHRVGGETEAFLRFEALHRLHQADIALRNHFGNRKTIAPIAHGYFGDQAQVTGDELVSCNAVAMLPPALGEHKFLLRLQHREPADFVEVSAET